MKNIKKAIRKARRSNSTTKAANLLAAWRNFLNPKQFKNIGRRALSAFFVFALVAPLVALDGAQREVRARDILCYITPHPDQIFQGCPLDGTLEYDLTQQAIDDVMELYEVPRSERHLLMKHAREEVRSMLYVRMLELANKENPTQLEQRALNNFAGLIKAKRIEAAQLAKAEYVKWNVNRDGEVSPVAGCGYVPPAPFTYSPGGACTSQIVLVYGNSTIAPSFEEFEQFGAALAYADMLTPEAQKMSTETTRNIIRGSGVAAPIVGSRIGATVGAQLSFGTLRAVLPQAGFKTVQVASQLGTTIAHTIRPAATAASGAVGASAVAGPVAIIIAAVATAVMQGVQVGQASQLRAKLDQAIVDKQNETINLRDLANGDDWQRQEFMGAFLRSTLPDFPSEERFSPRPDDPTLIVKLHNSDAPVDTPHIAYTPIDNNSTENYARLRGSSWFLVRGEGEDEQSYRLRLSIGYNLNPQKTVFTHRVGTRFVTAEADSQDTATITDQPLVAGRQLARYQVKITDQQRLVVQGYPKTGFHCFDFDAGENGERVSPVTLGYVPNTGATAPEELQLSVNGATSAIDGDFRLQELRTERSQGNTTYIVGNVYYTRNEYPLAGEFTITARNNFGIEQTFKTGVKKTVVVDTLPAELPKGLLVGESARMELSTNNGNVASILCSGYSYSITGELPPGLRFENDHRDGGYEPARSDVRLVGTAASDGTYTFTVHKHYTNGETLSRTYRIVVRGELHETDQSLMSWWRGETDAEDFTRRADGTSVGRIGSMNAKVNRGWRFDGTNKYIGLPDNTFRIPSSSFTFETWFKTPAKGVILARQNGNVVPYNTPQTGARPLLYVDQNGKLRAGFGSGAGATISQRRVDDNNFHHVAVTFSESGGGAVYLDGESIGANGGRAQTAANQKFQFGAGYVSDAIVGGMQGWFNFTGTIDEAALYSRMLSADEIRAIFAAGAAGKMQVSTASTAPTARNSVDGTITITADGGVKPLEYSIDNGATFKTTGVFTNLPAGTYPVIVRDEAGHDVRRTITLDNPPPNLYLRTAVTNAQCAGSGGAVRILPTGGSGNYEYSLLNGANRQTHNIFRGVTPGTYTPWIRDVDSDTTLAGSSITVSAPPGFSISPTNFNNAAINQAYSQTFTVSGGTPGYSLLARSNSGGDLPDDGSVKQMRVNDLELFALEHFDCRADDAGQIAPAFAFDRDDVQIFRFQSVIELAVAVAEKIAVPD